MRVRNKGIYILLLVVLMVFAGCRPKGVLSSKQMREVLYDLHKADAVLRVAGLETVLEKHGITQAQFDSSLVWYTDHPSRFDKMYPKIEKRCKAEYDEIMLTLDNGETEETKERDLPPVAEVMEHTLYGWPKTLWEPRKVSTPVPFVEEND